MKSEKLEEKPILDICYITDGTHDSPKQHVDGFYLVTGKHLIEGFIDFSSAYFISEADHDKIQKRSKVANGDLVLSNIGTIGNVAIIDSPFEFSVKNVIIFKPNNSEYSSFLYCYLNSDDLLWNKTGLGFRECVSGPPSPPDCPTWGAGRLVPALGSCALRVKP